MARTLCVALLLALAVLLPPAKAAPAAGAKDAYSPPAWPKAPPVGRLLGRLALITVLALAVAGSTLWWARRAIRVPIAAGGAKAALGVIGSVPLGAGCSLHLLEVDRACFVVGVDRTGLKAIHFVSEPFEECLNHPPASAVPPSPLPEAERGQDRV